ncbi:BNR/Asp-box repeat protein [Symmachiella dynata]|nr:BNR/Asp-box repeat protein [Symmachiella dynata]
MKSVCMRQPKTMNSIFWSFCFALILTSHSLVSCAEESVAIEHKIAAIEEDRFHGWPANNGVWQWGDEFLVGFTQGDFELKSGHNIAGRQDSLLARSQDGGLTWQMFDPPSFLDDENAQYLGEGKTKLTQPLDFRHSGFALRIFADGYHGNHDPEGGFFYSNNRGANWNGPYALTGLKDHPEMKDKLLSPRTDYLVQSPDHCMVFISTHVDDPKLKRIACIQTTDGGQTFEFVSWVTPESEEASAIMSQTVQLSDQEFVLAYRKIYRNPGKQDEIEAYHSADGGKSWQRLSTIKEMPTHSNPPALLKLTDGRLCCVYGDRHVGEIRGRYSRDRGKTWGPELVIRDDFQALPDDPDSSTGLNTDIGYPRLVQRSDGKLVAIYYWATAENPQQHIAVSIWSP